ncbi:cytochrome P450 9e2-like isoform X2 [Leptinotarsa decemlineata]|uniref:cytochrome P450 9e2-like isoform X2 n=1 Tax=Leptinotarsa decemlineata TaxID=7539 RepID=UPI003D30BC62
MKITLFLFDMFLIIIGTAILAALFYYVCIKPMSYWRERGVKQTDPIWVFGDNWMTATKKESFLDFIIRCYNYYPGARYHGVYQFLQPTLLVKDPELLKKITVKDFEHFTDHRVLISEDSDPHFGKNLFALTGKKWRDMRPILSPSFTSSKMRAMFVLMSKCAEDFTNHFLKKDQECIEMEMKDTFTRFTNDVIATTAFGIKVDSLEEPNNKFYLMGKETTDFSGFWKSLKMTGFFLVPKLLQYLRISFLSRSATQFFSELVDETIKTREEKNIIRPDMIHLLIQARKGIQQKEENVGVDTGFATVVEADLGKGKMKEITNMDITAQALIFFFAGFDAVSALMCFMSYELAVNPDIQAKLRKEIEDTLSGCGKEITYEALLKMKYMDMVMSESLRKWPNAVATDRVCTKPYVIEPTNPEEKPLYIEKNTLLMIPIVGIHRDPKYYPEPMRFNPERFSDENKGKIDPFTYLPFGLGPRNCIASRFALLEAKVVFFHLLSHFELVPVEKTPIPLKISKQSFNMVAEGGFWLGLKRLKK